ncbi:MAG: FAD-dependent oxidoreductase [Clostridia bacterium]|nr:FAD-dependent oxidoreductase [Clostridia bacterium]
MKIIHTDILVLGLGSAGSAAVYRALQGGASVVGAEQMAGPGGTSACGGVNNWEPGVSFPGMHTEIARRLMDRGDAFVGKTTEYVSAANRFATSDRSGDPYETTLKRFGVHPDDMRRLHYEPDAMSAVLQELMEEADSGGRLTLFYNTRFVSLDIQNRRIRTCVLDTPSGPVTVCPKQVIDCTGDLLPARMAGCTCVIGEDARETYGEEAAPDRATRFLNGLTQCFRITETGVDMPGVPEEYDDVDLTGWVEHMNRTMGPVSCFNVYPRGGIYVNMLPTGEGDLYLQYDMPVLKHICEARAYRYMQWLAEKGYLRGWEITHMFPLLGLRESWRLVGRYVLTIEDIYSGYAPSLGKEHTIAIADHPADTHGRGSRCKDTYPGYGIPYECLLPKETDNLLVACRGASFTHLAASSTRLSRTMLQLGEAAGTAAAMCIRHGYDPADVDLRQLRQLRGIE